MFALDFFDAMPHVAGTYTDSAGTFALRVNLLETDKAFRTSTRDQLIGSSVSGTIVSDARVRRGGRIHVGATEYRVDGVIPSSVPGLSDLKLDRRQGPAVLSMDATGIVSLDTTVQIAGEDIPAHINPSVEVESVGDDGTSMLVSRMMVAIRSTDAARLGVKAGTRVRVDGKNRAVAQAMADGLGFEKLLL